MLQYETIKWVGFCSNQLEKRKEMFCGQALEKFRTTCLTKDCVRVLLL